MGSIIPHDVTEMPNLLATPFDTCPCCQADIITCDYLGQVPKGSYIQARIINLYNCPNCQEDFGIVIGYRTYHTLFEN